MTAGASPLLIYGGTFDPVHNGHLAVAREAHDRLGCAVRLMPAGDPPHRAAPGATAAQRARMLDLAVAGEPGLQVDRRELRRDGPSYTVDTLRGLRAEVGDRTPVVLLVGADSLLGLPSWREWRSLPALAHVVVAGRPGSPAEAELPAVLEAALADRWTEDPEDLRRSPAGRLLWLRQPLRPESATGIRARIAAGADWDGLVPAAVAGFIRRHALYGAVDGAGTPAPI